MAAKTSEPTMEPRVVETTDSKNSLSIEIAGAAIFGALSLVLSALTTAVLPRFVWGMAYFDPVSLIWIMIHARFGKESGRDWV